MECLGLGRLLSIGHQGFVLRVYLPLHSFHTECHENDLPPSQCCMAWHPTVCRCVKWDQDLVWWAWTHGLGSAQKKNYARAHLGKGQTKPGPPFCQQFWGTYIFSTPLILSRIASSPPPPKKNVRIYACHARAMPKVFNNNLYSFLKKLTHYTQRSTLKNFNFLWTLDYD